MHSPAARRAGFTLIELLVVLAIVSTLLLLVAPRYFHNVDATKEAVLRENLRAVRDVLDKFHADAGRYPRDPGRAGREEISAWLAGGPGDGVHRDMAADAGTGGLQGHHL